MVIFGEKSRCIWAKVGCTWEKVVVFGQIGSIWAKVVLFEQKVVVFGQNSFYLGKSSSIWAKGGCIFAKVVVLVRQIRAKFYDNCSVCAKSTKFGAMIAYVILINIGYGPHRNLSHNSN